MCAIVDTNCAGEIFNPEKQVPAGRQFLKWIDSRGASLVAAGQLLNELRKSERTRRWLAVASAKGILLEVDEAQVEKRARELRRQKADGSILTERKCESNDAHIIALAQVTGARLLYSKDGDLHRDFKNHHLIKGPRGTVYSTKEDTNVTRAHKRILEKPNLCATCL